MRSKIPHQHLAPVHHANSTVRPDVFVRVERQLEQSSRPLNAEGGLQLKLSLQLLTGALASTPFSQVLTQKVLELPRKPRMPELPKRLGFDLTNALTCQAKLLSHLI